MTSINPINTHRAQHGQEPIQAAVQKPVHNMNFLLPGHPAPPPQNPLQRLMSDLQTLFSTLNSMQSAISDQGRADRAAGMGVFEGAGQYSQAVKNSISNVQRYENQQAPAMQSQGGISGRDIAHEFGAYAQEYMMGRISREALSQVAQRLGVDVSSMSFTNLADSAMDFISGRASSEVARQVGVEAAAEGITGNIGATFGKVLGAAGAAYSIYNIADNWGNMSPVDGAISGATTGAYIGSMIVPGVGTAIGAVVGGVVGAIGGLVKKGKHPDQKMRDQVRHAMQDKGMLDKDWNLTLANGAKFDIGRDGRNKIDSVDGSQRAVYQLDFNHPLAGETIGMANPLAKLLTGGDEKLSADFVGYFVNAALSNAETLEDARANMAAIFQSFNIAPEHAAMGLEALHAEGKVTAEELPAFINGVYSIVN